MQRITIESSRLQLVELSHDDLPLMMALANEPQVTRHMDYIAFTSKDDATKWLKTVIQAGERAPRESYNLAIVLKASDKKIGWIGIGEPDSPGKGDMDFGYALLPDYWGHGYTTESLDMLIKYVFNNHEISTIYGECDDKNTASVRVMQKVGMKEVRRFLDTDLATGHSSTTVGFEFKRKTV